MLPRKHRVGKQYFPQAHHQGRSFFSDLFTLKILPAKDVGAPARFSVVVSAKVAKQAVVRNKIKRRVYGAIRASGGLLQQGTTSIFYIKKGATGASYAQVAGEVARLVSAAQKKPK